MIKISGYYTAICRGPDGEVKDQVEGKNVITSVGKEFLASFLSSAAAGAATFTMQYLAVGSGSSAEADTDTALGTEIARHTGTVSYISNQIYQVIATFATGVAAGDIAEYGIFSSNTAGTMISRDTESTLAIGANDTLTVTAQITFS